MYEQPAKTPGNTPYCTALLKRKIYKLRVRARFTDSSRLNVPIKREVLCPCYSFDRDKRRYSFTAHPLPLKSRSLMLQSRLSSLGDSSATPQSPFPLPPLYLLPKLPVRLSPAPPVDALTAFVYCPNTGCVRLLSSLATLSPGTVLSYTGGVCRSKYRRLPSRSKDEEGVWAPSVAVFVPFGRRSDDVCCRDGEGCSSGTGFCEL